MNFVDTNHGGTESTEIHGEYRGSLLYSVFSVSPWLVLFSWSIARTRRALNTGIKESPERLVMFLLSCL